MLPYPVFRLLLYCVFLGINKCPSISLVAKSASAKVGDALALPTLGPFLVCSLPFQGVLAKSDILGQEWCDISGIWCFRAEVLQLWSASVNDLGFSLWLSSTQCFAWLFAVVDFSGLGWKSEHLLLVVLSFGAWYAFCPSFHIFDERVDVISPNWVTCCCFWFVYLCLDRDSCHFAEIGLGCVGMLALGMLHYSNIPWTCAHGGCSATNGGASPSCLREVRVCPNIA